MASFIGAKGGTYGLSQIRLAYSTLQNLDLIIGALS